MKKNTLGRLSLVLIPASVLGFSSALAKSAIKTPHEASGQTLKTFTLVKRTPSLMLVQRGAVRIELRAVSKDIFRVRIGREGQLPPNESWAVTADKRDRLYVPAAGDKKNYIEDSKTAFGLKIPGGTALINKQTGAVSVLPAGDAPALSDVSLPFYPDRLGFRLVKKLGKDSHIFGLGDKNAPLDQRGYVHQNWNTDPYFFQERQEPLYKDIPFFMVFDHGKASGIFLDNTWRSVFDFGLEHEDEMRFGADGGKIDYYLFTGPTPQAVMAQYSFLTGRSPLPPKWAFGYHQSRYSYEDEKTYQNIAQRLEKDKIPADALWLDIGYQDRNRPFTVDRKKFPHFEKMLEQLKQKGFHTVAITDLHIAHAPHENYAPYDKGAKDDLFVHDKNGKPYIGNVWPGASLFPDFTTEKARAYWGSLYQAPHLKNADGFWNDMNEPSVFDGPGGTMPVSNQHKIEGDGMAPRIASHAEIHNVFGMENARATYEGLLKNRPNERPFVMTRAAYAGGQRFGATWSGDNGSTWNALRLSTPSRLNLGLSGFPFVGANIGGFTGSPPPDLLTKWMEIGMFHPIADNHSDLSTRAQEPWADGKKHEDIRRHYIEMRYKLLPYIYTLAEESSRTGAPMMRPLFYYSPDIAGNQPLDRIAQGEFLLGRDLLIAPQWFNEQNAPWNVILPPGQWYDYASGQKVKNMKETQLIGNSGTRFKLSGDQVPHKIQETPSLERLPVFARAGAIIAHQPLVLHSNQIPKGALALSIYAGKQLEGSVYEDDGHSLNYQKGEYFRQHFLGKMAPDGSGELVLEAPEGRYQPWWKNIALTFYGMAKKPQNIRLNGQKIQARYDRKTHCLKLLVPAASKSQALNWEG